MIAFVRGKVYTMGESTAVLDTGHFGMEIYMTNRDLAQLRVGAEILLHTYFQVREDAMTLYGFREKDDLEVFQMLLGISGIGPKAALGILGAIKPNDLRFAVLSDDVKTISSAPGVGKKTAQKLILELKDKFNLQDTLDATLQEVSGTGSVDVSGLREGPGKEAIEALVALGYSMPEASKAVGKVELQEGMDAEAVLKKALKFL